MNPKFKWFTGVVVALYFLAVNVFYELPFGSSIFQDVPGNHWALYDIEEMYNRGLMKGRDETVWNFYPDKEMTRAELIALMLKIDKVEIDKLPKPQQSKYEDVPAQTHWAAGAIAEADKRGIIPFKDVTGTTFKPDQPITRGELSQAVIKALNVPISQEGKTFSDTQGNPYEDAIRTAVDHKYAQGNEDGLFRPDELAKREQVASMFARALREYKPLSRAEREEMEGDK